MIYALSCIREGSRHFGHSILIVNTCFFQTSEFLFCQIEERDHFFTDCCFYRPLDDKIINKYMQYSIPWNLEMR